MKRVESGVAGGGRSACGMARGDKWKGGGPVRLCMHKYVSVRVILAAWVTTYAAARLAATTVSAGHGGAMGAWAVGNESDHATGGGVDGAAAFFPGWIWTAVWLVTTCVRLACALAAVATAAAVCLTGGATKDTHDTSRQRGLLTNRFHPSKVPERVDAVVIGSGMSGLSCASVLAQAGRSVLVLEQHDIAGGGTHTYTLGDGYTFDSGLHYTVSWSSWMLWLAAGTPSPPVDFVPLGDGGEHATFDRIVVGSDAPFEVRHGEEHLDELYNRFPDNQDDIDKYLETSSAVMSHFPLWIIYKALPRGARWLRNWWWSTFLEGSWQRLAGRTAEDVIKEITGNPRLQSLLSGLWIDTGSPPDRASFFIGASVFRGLAMEGAVYPRRGSDAMARALVPVIESAGGRVLVQADVSEITVDVDTNRVTGVVVNGVAVACPLVVSSCGYANTYDEMLRSDVTDRFGVPRAPPVDQSPGFIMCNVGLECTAEQIDSVGCVNTWTHPIDGTGGIFDELRVYWRNPADHEPACMITFPSLKDRGGRRGGKLTCQILCCGDAGWFDRWRGTPTGARGADYEQAKEAWKAKCVRVLLRHYPQLEGCVRLVDLSTPLTIEHYLRDPRGGAIGLDPVPRRFTDRAVVDALDTETPVPGLWLTGQDALLCGVPLAQASGLITGFRVLGAWPSLRLLAGAAARGARNAFWVGK